jgi:hypothetical protein
MKRRQEEIERKGEKNYTPTQHIEKDTTIAPAVPIERTIDPTSKKTICYFTYHL